MTCYFGQYSEVCIIRLYYPMRLRICDDNDTIVNVVRPDYIHITHINAI